MFIQFLGTGAGTPSKSRNVSSLALKLLDELNEIWLFDCGEATQHQILHTTLKPRKISRIFISHMHGDHIFGLPGLLSSRSFQGGQESLTVYGPEGIKQFIQTSLKLSRTRLSYPIHYVELDSNGGTIALPNNWRVDYLPLNHGILSFGFRVTEPDSIGELLVDKLKTFNIPNGPIFGQLKRGEIVTLEDGQKIDGKDFVAPDKKGRVVCVLGDTRKCQNAFLLANGVNTLVHEATFEANEESMATNYCHSTNQQAAEIAREAQVEKLLLNHISARYLGKAAKELEKQAQLIFANTKVVFDLEEYQI